jgi:hypothetical protein
MLPKRRNLKLAQSGEVDSNCRFPMPSECKFKTFDTQIRKSFLSSRSGNCINDKRFTERQ